MDFTPVISSVGDMEAWNANGNGFSFVISRGSRSGPGFRGQIGFMASWRPGQNSSATEVGGSPFETLAEAVNACKSMASLLTKTRKESRSPTLYQSRYPGCPHQMGITGQRTTYRQPPLPTRRRHSQRVPSKFHGQTSLHAPPVRDSCLGRRRFVGPS
jgi:hypothetical protein